MAKFCNEDQKINDGPPCLYTSIYGELIKFSQKLVCSECL